MLAVRMNRRVWCMAMLTCALLPQREARAAGSDSALTAQLNRHFKLAKAELAANGAAAIGPGTVWNVRMEGIVGFAEGDQAMEDLCPATYSDDTLHPSAGPLCTLTSTHGRKAFRVDDPVCVTGISASSASESVTMYLITCEPGKATLASQGYYAKLIFRFPPGYLRNATVDGIAETVSKVLSSDHAEPMPPAPPSQKDTAGKAPESDEPAGKGPTQETKAPPMAPVPPPPPPSDEAPAKRDAADPPSNDQPAKSAPAAETPAATPAGDHTAQGSSESAKVTKGDTPEQVQAVLGAPSRIANLGAKLIYFYPTMKIVFVDGKVSAVQQLDDKNVRGERDARNDKETDPND